jgi:hypothetical protein
MPRSLEFKVTIRKTSSLFVDHNLSPYNNKRWLGIGARHGDFYDIMPRLPDDFRNFSERSRESPYP